VETTFAGLAVELTQEVSSRLESDHYGWLTTAAKSGQPVPRLVWFYFDGNGAGIIGVGGEATVDATDVDGREDEPYWATYKADAEQFGLTEAESSSRERACLHATRRRNFGVRARSRDSECARVAVWWRCVAGRHARSRSRG
jgi:Pyridoxamine 5'-phosphate oxidase